jgi:hypothetical protein
MLLQRARACASGIQPCASHARRVPVSGAASPPHVAPSPVPRTRARPPTLSLRRGCWPLRSVSSRSPSGAQGAGAQVEPKWRSPRSSADPQCRCRMHRTTHIAAPACLEPPLLARVWPCLLKRCDPAVACPAQPWAAPTPDTVAGGASGRPTTPRRRSAGSLRLSRCAHRPRASRDAFVRGL